MGKKNGLHKLFCESPFFTSMNLKALAGYTVNCSNSFVSSADLSDKAEAASLMS